MKSAGPNSSGFNMIAGLGLISNTEQLPLFIQTDVAAPVTLRSDRLVHADLDILQPRNQPGIRDPLKVERKGQIPL